VSVVVDGAPAPLELMVGDEVPAAGGVYAKRPSESRVVVVPSWSASSFDKKPFDLRDRDLLHVKRDQVRTLAAQGPEGSYALERGQGDEWSITAPVATRAGRWPVDALLGAVEGLRMESIAAESAPDLKRFGLVKPARTVTLGLTDGTTRVLELGASAGDQKVYARAGGAELVAVVPGALADQLAKGLAELRAKRLLELSTFEVQAFDAITPAGTRSYAKNETKDAAAGPAGWKRTAPDPKDLDANTVEDALFKVGGVEAQEFLDRPQAPSAYGLEPPALRLVVRSTGKPETWIELGRQGDAFYARRSGDAAVLKIDAARGEELLKAFSAL
jgi:hypothetical protein